MANGIKFKKVELKAYPFLEKLEIGQKGVGIGTEYLGYSGVVKDIRYGKEKTNKEVVIEIVMDFKESQYHFHQSNKTGLALKDVVMTEENVGIMFESWSSPMTLEGKIVCTDCHTALDTVIETQYDDITWFFHEGKYRKENGPGGSDGKKCTSCNASIDDEDEILSY